MSWIEDPGIDIFQGKYNLSSLNVDEAWMNVSTYHGINIPLWIYELSTNCHQCAFQRKFPNPIPPNDSRVFRINTQFPTLYRLATTGSSILKSNTDKSYFCEVESFPSEFGVYELAVDSQNCTIHTKLEPVNIYLPLAIIALFYICFGILVAIIKRWRSCGQLSLNIFSFVCCKIGRMADNEEFLSSLSSNIHAEDEDNDDGGNDNATMTPSTSTSRRTTSSIPTTANTKPPSRSTRTPNVSSTNDDRNEAQIQRSRAQQIPLAPVITTSHPNYNSSSNRLKSIDTFRGLCIIIMIFADDGGGMYYFFEHSTWDGLYVADLAFPWFLWIMGVCIPIALRGQILRSSTSRVVQKIFHRAIKLIILGLIMNTSSSSKPIHIGNLRLPGVLQRFGICYLMASILFLYLLSEGVHSSPWRKLFRKLIPRIIIVLCVVAHTMIVFYLPVPGCPTGYMGPSGLHLNGKYPSKCIGGATGYIDRLLFSNNHIYQRPTARKVYKSGVFDPEGTLGLLTSLLQVWLGIETGEILSGFHSPIHRLKRLWILSILCGSCGYWLSGGIYNNGWIPVNKNLWSLSFVFVTTCLALLLLSLMYIVIDYKKWWSGSPFYKPGMNSILLYVGHNVFHSVFPWHFALGSMNTHFLHLIENLWGTSLWILLSMYLYSRKLFWVI